jgi:hypothetical protein
MKKLPLFIGLLLCGCLGKMDNNKAKTIVEALIQKENSGDYQSMSQFYTNDFNEGEPVDSRTTKFKTLHDSFGDMTSMEALSVRDSTDPNELNCVYLVYRVKHAKMNTVEKFTVINDEGTYKVEQHSIDMEH